MKLGLEAGDHTYVLAERHGVAGVPISIGDLVAQGAEDALEPLRSRGLQVCQIGAIGYNPLSPDAKGVAEQTRLLKLGIPLAASTGCPAIAISCGSYAASAYGGYHRENFSKAALDDMAAALEPLLGLAEESGAILSIEAYIKGVVHSPESFDRLAEICGSPALKINLDITSLYDLKDLIDPEPICRSVMPKLEGKVGIVHLKGIALQEGFHIQAGLAPITDDPTDWKLVLEETNRVVDDDTWAILEHVLSEEEGDRSIPFIKQIAADLSISI